MNTPFAGLFRRIPLFCLTTLLALSVSHAQTVEVVGGASSLVNARTPVINDAGDVFYVNNASFVVGNPTTPILASYGSISGFLKPAFGDETPYVFQTDGTITYVGSSSLIQTNSSQKLVVAQSGATAFGLATDKKYSTQNSGVYDFAASPDKSVTFRSTIINNGSFGLDIAVYAGTAGNLTLVMDSFHDAPGIPGYQVWNNGNFHTVRNTNGVSVFTGIAKSASAGDFTCIWLHDAVNGVRLLYKPSFGSGQLLPGIPDSTISSVGFDVNTWTSINDQGQLAFSAQGYFNSNFQNIQGVFAGLPGSMQVVATNGLAVPGIAGATFQNFASFDPVHLGSNGKVVFSANIQGAGIGSTNSLVLVMGSNPSDLKILARAGAQAPGMPVGVLWSTNGIVDTSAKNEEANNFTVNDPIVIFGNNRVAFLGSVIGSGVIAAPSASANNSGIWLVDESGNISLFARRGTALTTTTGSQNLTSYFKLQGGTGQDGKPSGGNRNGQFVFVNGTNTFRTTFTSTPLLLNTPVFVGNQVQLSFPTDTGKSYLLQSTDLLVPPTWSDVQTFVGDGTTKQYLVTPNVAQRYYHLLRTPAP